MGRLVARGLTGPEQGNLLASSLRHLKRVAVALVAYPASYGSNGITTFIVNQDGIVYQKNPGKEAVGSAEAMTRFDPDKSWTRVDWTSLIDPDGRG